MSKYTETRKVRAISTVYQRGKTQIPSEVRKNLGISDGDKLLWIIEENKWVVERA